MRNISSPEASEAPKILNGVSPSSKPLFVTTGGALVSSASSAASLGAAASLVSLVAVAVVVAVVLVVVVLLLVAFELLASFFDDDLSDLAVLELLSDVIDSSSLWSSIFRFDLDFFTAICEQFGK